MTPDLQKIRAYSAAATAGPWEPAVWRGFEYWIAIGPMHECGEGEDSEPDCPAEQKAQIDAAFIAQARTDLPLLVDYCQQLETEVKRLK